MALPRVHRSRKYTTKTNARLRRGVRLGAKWAQRGLVTAFIEL